MPMKCVFRFHYRIINKNLLIIFYYYACFTIFMQFSRFITPIFSYVLRKSLDAYVWIEGSFERSLVQFCIFLFFLFIARIYLYVLWKTLDAYVWIEGSFERSIVQFLFYFLHFYNMIFFLWNIAESNQY